MINSPIKNIDSMSVDELVYWINSNPNLLYHYNVAIMDKISKIKLTRLDNSCGIFATPESISKLIEALFTNRDTFTNYEFNLLTKLSASLIE